MNVDRFDEGLVGGLLLGLLFMVFLLVVQFATR